MKLKQWQRYLVCIALGLAASVPVAATILLFKAVYDHGQLMEERSRLIDERAEIFAERKQIFERAGR